MSTTEKKAFAIAVVLEEIRERRGDAAADRANGDPKAFLDAVNVVVVELTAAAIEQSKIAGDGVGNVGAAAEREAALEAYRKVEKATTTACRHAENIATIASLAPGQYAAEVVEANHAAESAREAYYEAFAALGLEGDALTKFVMEENEADARRLTQMSDANYEVNTDRNRNS